MEKATKYPKTKFSVDCIRKALEMMTKISSDEKPIYARLNVETDNNVVWSHDTIDEFFSDYRTTSLSATIDVFFSEQKHRIIVTFNHPNTRISITALKRQDIVRLFSVFDDSLASSRISEEEVGSELSSIFIGHGGSSQWKELKDHLQDSHGYRVVAYEIGARSGHTIRDVLEEMLCESDMAFLVLTAEDENKGGAVRARQNVVHELGLFQGRLGFGKAIAIAEENTELFSNLDGIQQIRYSTEKIKETFGEILATIRRESTV